MDEGKRQSRTQAMSRRDFLRSAVGAGAGWMVARSAFAQGAATSKAGADTLHVAIIGTGVQGRVLLKDCLKIPGVRFKAGATKTLTLTIPGSAAEMYRTDSKIIQEIDRLLDHHTETEIAKRFNDRGLVSSRGSSYTPANIITLRLTYKLKCRFDRLRERGYLRTKELARKLHVGTEVVSRWGRQGLLRAHYYGDKLYLYEDPTVGTDATPEEVRDRLRATPMVHSKATRQERGAV